MKRTIVVITALTLLLAPLAMAQSEADQAYIKAMTAQSAAQKAKLLKEYISKYAGQGTKYENFAYANLCLLQYPGKTPQETINYGEKALALGGLDDLTKAQVLIQVAGIYTATGQNLSKAQQYAAQIIQVAKANKAKAANSNAAKQWQNFQGAGYFIQAQAMEKAKNYSGALKAYLNSYSILKNKQIITSLKKIGKALYDSKKYNEAAQAFKLPATSLNDYPSLVFYAKSLHRAGKTSEALKYYKQAYNQQKSGEIAYNIGIILAARSKTNPAVSQEAIDYLLQAAFLSQSYSEKAMKLAESLFFTQNPSLKYNETVKELADRAKKLENLTNTFNTKFGNKDEEELSEAEKEEMQNLLKQIEAEQQAIQKLEAQQKAALEKFNQLIAQTKQKLGIK
ncbi:MAG: hypothetical protein DRI99_07210 [Candidatus Aminicenantes bacterium]|nr:hypothetical protein [Candidatus Aminicenantes bacterium]RLE01520.1 MAG: hypothetical protein DRI99_07210 [Candidatus Aminicenantes bacterium]RLE03134.1 MAG: hypothetical protein DRJ11_05215 [Candidatus Aminicenantes bacterium]HHF43122.1 hypothetical protein [Candidatus Aminicenantes bacterium]